MLIRPRLACVSANPNLRRTSDRDRLLNAYVAVTDQDWYDFLSRLDREREDGVDEVNFWTPKPWRGRFGVLSRGEPLLFKLKAPHNAIAGGGFFQHYTKLPLSLAWRAFGAKNGTETQQAFWDRIARLRRERMDRWKDPTIGCILLIEPFFWPRELWIPQPEDWGPTTVRGAGYDLRTGIGRRLWDAVVERLQARPEERAPDPPEIPGGFGDPIPMRRRLGQGTFRILVTDAYGRECAVTRERALPALDAAHIRPFADRPEHDVRNGLLLRSDVHDLFDAGYLTVTPEYRVEASGRMREDFDDGKNYLRLQGSKIRVPERKEFRPDPDVLRWHNENRFRG